MFEGLRNPFFPQSRDAALPALQEQRGSASDWREDPARAPAPAAERGQPAAAPATAATATAVAATATKATAASATAATATAATAAALKPLPPPSVAAVAQRAARLQSPERVADPLPEQQQAVAAGPQQLPLQPGPAASRPSGNGRNGGVITIDNRRYQLANLPGDVRQLVADLQAADRVIAHRRSLRGLLLASRQRLLDQLQRGLQAQASLPPESN